MPNAFDTTSLTVKVQADAAIRIEDHPNDCGPGEPYSCAFLYYRGVPPATGFAIDWYETLANMNTAPDTTPGGGTVLTTGAPQGTPTNQSGGGVPEAGNPLPPVGTPAVGVATGKIVGGRAPTLAPDGNAFSEDKTYYARIWILQA